jgi:hypothetical protein
VSILSAAWSALTGAGEWVAVADEALKLGNKIADAMKTKQDRDQGATAQREATDEATLDTIARVTAPVDNSTRDELWNKNKARFGVIDGGKQSTG